MADGEKFYAYLPGGASGGILPAGMADIALDFDTVQEADETALSGRRRSSYYPTKTKRAMALNVMRFFEDESCGQCTPCRVGTAKAAQLMLAEKWDAALLEELSKAMQDASICGLGQAAPNALRSVIRHFADEVC